MKRIDSLDIVNKSKEYKTATHLTFSCQYHVIFYPKYRRSVLKDGIDVRLKEIIYEVANSSGRVNALLDAIHPTPKGAGFSLNIYKKYIYLVYFRIY